MSRELNSQNERLSSRSRKPQIFALALALMVVVLCTAVGAAQENSGLPDNVIMAEASDFPLSIPDDGSWLQVGTVDNLAPHNGTVNSVNLKVLIDHPNPDQLQMQLVKDGYSSTYPLATAAALAMEGGAIGMMNIGVFAGAAAEGPWTFSVRDLASGGQGYLNGISVVVTYESAGSREITSSVLPGTPTAFSLPAGASVSSDSRQNTTGTHDSPNTRTPEIPTAWETITFNGFGSFPYPDWTLLDQSTGGNWYWGDTTCKPHSGSWSGWPAESGADALTPCVDNYANDMTTWMIYGPFDLSDAYDARTRFYMWRELEECCDRAYFGWSNDGTNYLGYSYYGNAPWTFHDIYYADMTGLNEVWVAWVFLSDVSVTYAGPFVDDISIEKNVLGTPSLSAISNADGNGNYTLNWSAAEGAQSYEVQEQRNGGSWSTIFTTTSTSQSISGRGGGEWCYRVRAGTDLGSSGAYSNIQCTWVIPDIPQISPISNSDGDGNYAVSWSSEVGASSYTLQERHNGGSWATVYSGSNTSHSVSGKSSGEWCYQAQAANTGGSSAWSSVVCTTVTFSAPTLNAISNPDGDGNYSVSWSTVSGASSYQLQERPDGGSWSSIYSGSNTSYSVSGKSSGKWCYQARAANTAGSSDWSNEVCTTVIFSPPTLYPISNSDGDGKFTVSWSTVSGASSYQLQEQQNGGLWGSIYSGSNTTRSISGRGVGDWCFRVQAANVGGSSGWSNVECTEVTLSYIHLSALFNRYANYFEGPMEHESNNSADIANGPLRFGQTYRGHPNDARDFFSFNLPDSGPFTVQLENHTGQGTQLQLFFQAATVGNRITYVTKEPYVISHNGQSGLYYIFIYSTGNFNSASEYTLTVTRP